MASNTNDALAQRANEVQAARDAVIQAGRELACNSYPDHCGRSVTPNRTFMNALEYALKKLGEAEMLPPEDAEPELPPRGVLVRKAINTVTAGNDERGIARRWLRDAEGGC